MKSYLVAMFSLTVAVSSLAQYQFYPYYTRPNANSPSGNNALRNAYGAGQQSWGGGNDRYVGSWEATGGNTNRATGGTAQFARGNNLDTLTLIIRDDVSGYFANVINNNQNFIGNTTTINVIGDATVRHSGYTIILKDNNNNNRSLGNWNFIGGKYYAGSGANAMFARNAGLLTFQDTSMYGGQDRSGVRILAGVPTLRNTTGQEMVFQAGPIVSSRSGGAGFYISGSAAITGGNMSFISSEDRSTSSRLATAVASNISTQRAVASPMAGLIVTGSATINGGSYLAIAPADGGEAISGGLRSTAAASGGNGVHIVGQAGGTISNSVFRGSNGGSASNVRVRYLKGVDDFFETALESEAFAYGGSGFYMGGGTMTMSNIVASGGNGGQAASNFEQGYADASGGSGIITRGTLTVTDGTYTGGRGGSANANDGEAYSLGGSGIWSFGTGALTINAGEFQGGAGGNANGEEQLGGAGVRKNTGTLNINGGTFKGAGLFNPGIIVENATLNLNNTFTDTLVDGNIVIARTGATAANILGGTITGDILLVGAGTTTLSIGTNAAYSGTLVQSGGILNASLTTSTESQFFKDVEIQEGQLNFLGAKTVLPDGSSIRLGSDASLSFAANGASLGANSQIIAGQGSITAGADIEMGANSSILFAYSSSIDSNGVSSINGGSLDMTAGNLVLSNSTAKIGGQAIAPEQSGTLQITTGGVDVGTNSVMDLVDMDMGWLVKVTNAYVSSGIAVDWGYNSLTNSALGDIDPALLANVDTVISSLTNTKFLVINSLTQGDGTTLLRYDLTQMPDVSESSIQVSQQVHQQIAARGTEFRSMNGFASTRPNFGYKATPAGAAGPGESKDMQGWIRAYGANGSKDDDGNFAAYDSGTYGTVIGVDKSFGNLLIGLAGGFSRTDLDGGAAYSADVETYHGSVYATVGGDSTFLDLALTYGQANTEEKSSVLVDSSDFDSDILSFYIGGGKTFEASDKIAITPEASLLSTLYTQDAFNRTGDILGGTGTIDEYDTESYLGSLGISLATVHQIDWLNRGLAFIPEVSLHWLHEFNPDPDDFTYTILGTPYSLGVRPRDEDLLRFGFGFDIWNWRYQSTKFEIDYDGLFSDTYSEHILSGKITREF